MRQHEPSIGLTLPNAYNRVMILCTARSRGAGIRRLPDREDAVGLIAAVQIETMDDAREVLADLDLPGRTIYVDVEPKQPVDLLSLAERIVESAVLRTIKPNDLTVDAAEALVLHHFGNQLRGGYCAVYGTGNLAFKIALRLGERGMVLQIHGQNPERVARSAAQLEAILPGYAARPVGVMAGPRADLLVSAVTGVDVIDCSWLDRLTPSALVVDVGIDNLAAEFIQRAGAAGNTCLRLDVRAAPHQVSHGDNAFFDQVLGRAQLGNVDVVAGGLIGELGDVIVDKVVRPRRVIGVANGTGGLVRPVDWSNDQREEVEIIETIIRDSNDSTTGQ